MYYFNKKGDNTKERQKEAKIQNNKTQQESHKILQVTNKICKRHSTKKSQNKIVQNNCQECTKHTKRRKIKIWYKEKDKNCHKNKGLKVKEIGYIGKIPKRKIIMKN